MKYFLATPSMYPGYDEHGTETIEDTLVLVAPNRVAAKHLLGAQLLKMVFNKSAYQNIKWKERVLHSNINFFDSSVYFGDIKECPVEHFEVLKQYFEVLNYNFEEMSVFGDYVELFSKNQMEREDFTEKNLFFYLISRDLTLKLNNTNIELAALSNIETKGFFVYFDLMFQMKTGNVYNCKITAQLNEDTNINEKDMLYKHDVETSMKIIATQNTEKEEKKEIIALLKEMGSDEFQEYATVVFNHKHSRQKKNK